MNYKPQSDYLVVRCDDNADQVLTSGVILLPPKEEPRESYGTVIAVGPGKCNKHGIVQPMEVKVGDRLAFSKYGHTKIDNLRVLREPSVHYVFE